MRAAIIGFVAAGEALAVLLRADDGHIIGAARLASLANSLLL